MLQLFPFAVWLAAITSAVLLAALWSLGDVGRPGLAVLLGWFLVSAYCQFLAGSGIVGAAGLGLQTMLAICLIFRWRLADRK